MRIVAVQTGLEADSVLGGEITDREFLLRLADCGAEIHVLTALRPGHPVLEHKSVTPHYYHRGWYKKVPYSNNLDVARALPKLLREVGPVDWIRFNSPYANGAGALAASSGHKVWGSYLHLEDRPAWKLLDHLLPRHCALITCLSQDTRDDLVARCPRADGPQTVVLPMGIDMQRIDGHALERRRIRQELGIKEEEVVLLFVGVAIPRKGIAELVAAWNGLRVTEKVRLLIISKPVAEAESKMIRELTLRDARVIHLSKVPYEMIPGYYWASDIFVFPTRREGFGIVVGEAMAAGLPVVTTRARGVRGVVAEGETALMSDVGDVRKLGEHLCALVNDPGHRRALGDAGRKRIEGLFSWPNILRSLLGHLV
jgi:glycosyltransferase involved in cell wall biosynthesis